MKRIRDLFYTGRGTFINQLISGYTGAYPPLWGTLDCSHEEIQTANKNGDFTAANPVQGNYWEVRLAEKNMRDMDLLPLCWTSTMRDKANGTVVRPAADVLKTPDNWCYVEYEVPERTDEYVRSPHWFSCDMYREGSCGWYEDGLRYMQYETDPKNNKGYAIADLAKFLPVLRHLLKDPKRNICSEFSHNAKVCFGLLPGPFKVVSPRESWLMSMRLHHLPTIHYGSGLVVHDGYDFVKDYKDILRAA